MQPPPSSILEARYQAVLNRNRSRAKDFTAAVNGLNISGYLDRSMSADQEYLITSADGVRDLSIVVNLNHPHVLGMRTEVLVDHLKHCVYEAMARWRLRQTVANGGPVELEGFSRTSCCGGLCDFSGGVRRTVGRGAKIEFKEGPGSPQTDPEFPAGRAGGPEVPKIRTRSTANSALLGKSRKVHCCVNSRIALWTNPLCESRDATVVSLYAKGERCSPGVHN